MRFDYEVLLPLLARMPLLVGRRLAWLRGLLYAGLDQDWRNHAVGFNWVASAPGRPWTFCGLTIP